MNQLEPTRTQPFSSFCFRLQFPARYVNNTIYTPFEVRGRLILAPDFVFLNRALDVMCEQKVTGFSGVPASYAMLLHKSNFEQDSKTRCRATPSARKSNQ